MSTMVRDVNVLNEIEMFTADVWQAVVYVWIVHEVSLINCFWNLNYEILDDFVIVFMKRNYERACSIKM